MSPNQKQTTKKISRNAPCPCGSGKKYKRCCGAEQKPDGTQVPKRVLKNTFREEVKDPLAGISPEELLKRDQLVMLAQHEAKQQIIEMDIAHLNRLESLLKELKIFISEQPISAARDASLVDIQNQLDGLAKQRAATFFSRPNEITMESLRTLLGVCDVVKHKEQQSTQQTVESEDRKMEQKLAEGPEPEQKPMPQDGPIETSGDDSFDDDDGEDTI